MAIDLLKSAPARYIGSATTADGQTNHDKTPPEPHMEAYMESKEQPHGSLYGGLAEKAAAEIDTGNPGAQCRYEHTIVGLFGLAALAICLYNIVVRFFAPRLTLDWSDEVQVYIVVWAIFLVLGVVTATDRHVKADLFVGMFSAATQRRLHLFSDILGLLFCGMLVYYGGLVTWQAYDFGDLSISSLRFPLWIYMAALPVGFSLAVIHYIIRIISHLRPRS